MWLLLLLFFPFFFCGGGVVEAGSFVKSAVVYRSNSTHIVWRQNHKMSSTLPLIGNTKRKRSGGGSSNLMMNNNNKNHNHNNYEVRRKKMKLPSDQHQFQLRKDAEKECLDYLRHNIMSFDIPFKETMGFPISNNSDNSDSDQPDGLDDGLIRPTIQLALDAKVQYPWTDDLPKDIFFNYVLNYANLNEARTNWRPLLVDVMKFNETDLWQSGEATLSKAVTWTNKNLWTLLGREGSPIYFKSSQTPLIFDPMSTIAFGYASCTGTSILFANALRAIGIPARVAGTPAWYGNPSKGNHNWVEVYDDKGEWKFLEPSPAMKNVDTLDADPCSRWFCDNSRYPATKVYAAKMSKFKVESDPDDPDNNESCHFPLAWETDCMDVPGVDRTQYYAKVCGHCDDMISKFTKLLFK